MPLFGRKPAAEDQLQVGPSGDLACDHPDCNRHDGVVCAYVDRRARACGTQWCPDHYHLMGRTPYCRRHIGIARALQLNGGDNEIRPDIDNRAPSLCEWVANVIHARVLELLAETRGSQASITVKADRLGLVIEGTPRVRYWERNWKLTDHQGTVIKLAVRVAEPVDRELILLAGREVLSTEVPPWVGQRLTDEAAREAFHDALMERLRTGAAAYLRRNAVGLRGRMENLPA